MGPFLIRSTPTSTAPRVVATLCAAVLFSACAASTGPQPPVVPAAPQETAGTRQPGGEQALAPAEEGTPPACRPENTRDPNKGWFRSDSEKALPDCSTGHHSLRGKDTDASVDKMDFFMERNRKIDQSIDQQLRDLNSGGK